VLLRIDDLHTRFFTEEGVVRAVAGVSLSIDAGEVLGVVGESGSGKSVMAMSILRLIGPPGRITGGKILWDEGDGQVLDLAAASERRMQRIRGDRIAMIFQDPMTSLNPYLTVGDQLGEVLEVHRGQKRAEARAACIAMLRAVGIPKAEARIDDHPHQLSGGMRQRVMIARALLCDPALLIADEPTTALDVTIQAQILDLLDEKRQSRSAAINNAKMAILLITHDLGVISKMADRVAVMYAGRVVEHAETAELFERPRHPYTLGLLASIPRLTDPPGKRLVPIKGLPPSLARVPSGCPFHPRCSHAIDTCAKEDPPERVVSGDPKDDRRRLHTVRCHVDL
jgi:oligopeptide/dipeptide ABC transporter ATP-binding protein